MKDLHFFSGLFLAIVACSANRVEGARQDAPRESRATVMTDAAATASSPSATSHVADATDTDESRQLPAEQLSTELKERDEKAGASCALGTIPRTACDRAQAQPTGASVGSACSSASVAFKRASRRLGRCYFDEVRAGRRVDGTQLLEVHFNANGEAAHAQTPGNVFGKGSACMRAILEGMTAMPEGAQTSLVVRVAIKCAVTD